MTGPVIKLIGQRILGYNELNNLSERHETHSGYYSQTNS